LDRKKPSDLAVERSSDGADTDQVPTPVGYRFEIDGREVAVYYRESRRFASDIRVSAYVWCG
jgi:hypothetical protein